MKDGNSHLLVGVCVDDFHQHMTPHSRVQSKDDEVFEMRNVGLLYTYMGIQVIQGKTHISLNQMTNEVKILEQYDMMNCNSALTPIETQTQACQEWARFKW